MASLVPFNRRNQDVTSNSFSDFYNMLDDFFSDNLFSQRSLAKDTFKVDIQETDKEYVIEADVPGVKKDEINVELLQDGKLNIYIKREEEVNDESKNYIHKERRFASMSRSIYLADAQVDGINAKLNDGVLQINVPKLEKKNNTIQIDIQ